jgi:bifunctional oligoribonuclease and PAP phosphatase NrnA
MKKDSRVAFKKLLKKSSKIVIVTHWNPDGDAIGSSLGLYNYLLKKEKKVTVLVPNAYPDFLNWLPGNKKVLNYQLNEKNGVSVIANADLVFTLDFNSFRRLDKLGVVLENSACPKVLIDHHPLPDNYADLYFHDEKACSTCELVYDFIAALGDEKLIDKKIASCLYTGIMTDTGSFRYPNVTAHTHTIISNLLKTGIVHSDIHSEVYDNYSYTRIKLLGFALSEKLKIVEGFPVAYITLSNAELKKFNFIKGDLEGLVNYPFSIKGISVCALMNESDNYIKMSLRSKGKKDMNKFARTYFNGGGHINAAGGRSDLSMAATEEKFVELIKTIF